MVDSKTFHDAGFTVVRGAVDLHAIDELLGHYLDLVAEVTGQRFESAHGAELAGFLTQQKELQGRIYDAIRRPAWLTEFSKAKGITSAARELIGREISLLRKIPFRIDVPMDTLEYAVWHQDQFYVRGNLDTVTAWIPLQDTTYREGCLKVMPGSHRGGPLEHDGKVGKRDYPSGIFSREVRYVEMARGDALFFHSCLVHSSSMNISSSIRYSVQARYSPTGAPTDAGMGGTIAL